MLSVIRCEPDPFTGERLNIGVVGVASNGTRLARVIQEPGRLECLYGAGAERVVAMAAAAAEAVRSDRPMPSAQLIVGQPQPFYNVSLEAAVNRAFDDLVTVALADRDRQPRPKALTDEMAEQRVFERLRKKIGLNMEILSNTPDVILQTARGPWKVHIPLQPPQGVGTVKSTDYGAATLRTHLNECMLDLACASQYRNKARIGLFLLRAERARADANDADSIIDALFCRAPEHMRIEVRDDPEALAQEIQAWSATAD